MQRVSQSLFILTVFLVTIASGGFALAAPQDVAQEKAIVMEEVVVTATRGMEEIRKVPAHVSIIAEEEIKKSGATNVVELLDKLEGIQIRSYSGNPAESIIDMRGFGGENPFGKTLILLDGRRMNRPDMRNINWLQISLNNIERIEVVRGASGVLYGDAAIGGVINIITKKGKGPPKFNASVIAGSYGLHNERVGVSGSTDKWNYTLTGDNNFSFGYRDRSKFSSRGGGFDVGYDASDRFNVNLGISFNKTDYQMPGALTKAMMEKDRRQYQQADPANFISATPDDDGSDKYTNINLGIKSFWGSLGQLDINFLYGKKDLQIDMSSWPSYTNIEIDTYGLTPKYILSKDIFSFKNKLTLGVDIYHEPFEKSSYSTRERSTKNTYTDLTRESFAYYIRDEFNILDPLILNVGYRQDRTTVKGTNTDYATPSNNWDDKKIHHGEAYEAGLTYLFGKTSNVYTKYATVYRIPFLDEQASYFGWGDYFNRNLEKETGKCMEVGTQLSPVEGLKLALSLFRIDMEDEIVWDGTKNVNMDKTRHDGAEISASYKLKDWAKIYGNFTYHKATFEAGKYNNKEVPLVPNKIANAGVEVNLPFSLMLRPEVRYVDKSYLNLDYDNVRDKLESYTLYNIYLFYRPTLRKVNITAFFGVENLTDEKYSSYGMKYGATNVYYPMPGIIYKGGLSFEF
ncbi:MAG: TonB-dependent receptor [Deltaproteobacteria bacterium]|nr:TonB-dependent receptor [Deltaproteobacteria bacterium]